MRLVTTKYSRFCGTSDVLHLGRWCAEDYLSTDDSWKFLPTRKVSVDQKLATSLEVSQIVERILPDLSDGLNAYHGIKRSHRYWRIILGRWLLGFADVVYQRNQLIERALAEFPISDSDGLVVPDYEMVGDCTQDYLSQLVSQEWNSALFAKLLVEKGIRVGLSVNPVHDSRLYPIGDVVWNQSALGTLYGLASRRSQIAIADPYIKRSRQFELALRTKSMPIRVCRKPLRTTRFDERGRNQFELVKSSDAPIESLIRGLLPLHLPRSVVESYERLSDANTWCGYPESPQSIFTANAHHSSDHFAIWAAEKVENGAELLISQHGGLYGESEIRTRHEEHELSIASKYLTWGWNDTRHRNIIPIPCLIGIGRKARKRSVSRQRSLVVVTDATFRFSRYSWDNTYERSQYITTLQQVVCELSANLKDEVVVRLHHSHADFDVDNASFFDSLTDVQIDDGRSSIDKLMNVARLAVVTTFGTTFGENIFRNTPTILCVNAEVYPPRDEFLDVYRNLESAKVLFWNPNEMCNFVLSKWPKIDEWWNSERVKNAVSTYQEHFFCPVPTPIKQLARTLLP